ncbi:MAG: hypothetical protein IPN75_12740 [Dechloromonas sp.]|uniref:Uncharacterized protein n=1 Tax=Candidatus Dechloromonas phosphorivorans TaxID=2899244 RepID=A0A9D7LRK5_9RHOO|nr:hypothetical protein [Candidatus Dechloromonas phosphorivorans]
MFKLQFQVAIAAGLGAVGLFMLTLLFKSGILFVASVICAILVPLSFLLGLLYVIYRKE